MENDCRMDRSELLELLVCNIEHARHVESERLSFNSIYIAVVAGFFALAFDFNRPLLTVFFIGILLVVSVVGLLFTKRWTDVFEEHSHKAQEIALRLYGDEKPNDHEDIVNKYYYFKHDYRRHTVADRLARAAGRGEALSYEEAEKSYNGFQGPVHKLCRIRTRTLFYFFYGIVITVLAIFFFFSIYQAVTL